MWLVGQSPNESDLGIGTMEEIVRGIVPLVNEKLKIQKTRRIARESRESLIVVFR